MSDRGEKIIHLAQELLRDGRLEKTPAALLPSRKNEEKNIALKAACLAALVSACGASVATHVLHETRRAINRYERTEIDALVFYAARQEGSGEQSLRTEIELALALPSLRDISVGDYLRVRNYLWNRLDRISGDPARCAGQ